MGGTERGGGDGNRTPACQHATPPWIFAGRRLQAAMCVRAGLTSQLQLLLLFLFPEFFFLSSAANFAFSKCRFTGSVRSVITLFCGHVLWALGEWKERKEGEPWSTPFAFTIEGMRCFAWSGRCVLWARRRPCRRVVGSAAARGVPRFVLFSTQTARPH